jgi:hypothetical protein
MHETFEVGQFSYFVVESDVGVATKIINDVAVLGGKL